MKKSFSAVIGKYPAFVFSFCMAMVWLESSHHLLGQGLSAVKKLPGKAAEMYFESGVRHFYSGDRQAAIDEFTEAIDLDPSFTAAYDARASVRFQMKDYADAIADCDRVIGVTDQDEHVYLIKGACRYYLHDIQDALKPLNTAILLNPYDALARDIRGGALTEDRAWDDAVADFDKAIQLNPSDGRAYFGRAAAELLLKEYEKSLADASNALAALNDDTLMGDAYGLRANVRTHLKDRAGALADANARIQLNTTDGKGYISRANVEGLWDDFSDASNDLRTAYKIDPRNSEIYLIRGMLEQKSGNFQASFADYSRGLVGDTEAFHAADVDEAMGYAQAEMGQWQPALELFRKAKAFKSPPRDVPFQLFLVECRLGQTQQAKEELAAYIQSIPAAKAHDWMTSEAHYLAGTLNETDFVAQATTTARRPTDISRQVGDAWYYAGMQHLLAGDRAGACECFKKSLTVGDDNSDNYMMTRAILKEIPQNETNAGRDSLGH